MVPTQKFIKARQSLLQVLFCTTLAWECMDNHIPFFPPRSIFKMMAIPVEMNSKKKGEENCGLLFISPIKYETFQAVVGQQRPLTKRRDARAN